MLIIHETLQRWIELCVNMGILQNVCFLSENKQADAKKLRVRSL